MRITELKLRNIIRRIIAEQKMRKLITKKDGSQRIMNFIRASDIKLMTPDEMALYGIPPMDPNKVVQDRPNVRTLQPGFELVWDLDAMGWRIVNMDTVQDIEV